uniref:Uncharacterized protein n=1 Tax=Hyaloperonospora arabidopsidis (strain Emoy2) TaxID=559515 RepID=M4B3T4_HYAAE
MLIPEDHSIVDRRRALKAATHYLNTHLQAPARKRFYRLLSRAVRVWLGRGFPSSGPLVAKIAN